MQVQELLGRDLRALERALQCIALAIKERDPKAHDTFMQRHVQVGLFYYSDQFTIGKLTFEMLKNGYDEKYHTFAVRSVDGIARSFDRQEFQKIRPAFDAFVNQYIAVYGNE